MEPPPRRGKREIRELVWERLTRSGAARPPFPVKGRIPNFVGAEKAGERITSTPQWKESHIIKINPDSPQRYIRYRALVDGKLLLMATPRIKRGFILLHPERIPRWAYGRASTIKGAFKYGILLQTLSSIATTVERVDLIVEGSVAVSIYGDRLGKGHGYGDLEYGILAELGLVNPNTPVFTSVHDLQVFNDRLPQDPHDVSVDIIATPTRILTTIGSHRRPKGILWNLLDRRKLEEIPILRELAEASGHG